MNNERPVGKLMDLVTTSRYSTEQLIIFDTITREALSKPLAFCTIADLDRAIEWLERMRTEADGTLGEVPPPGHAPPFPA